MRGLKRIGLWTVTVALAAGSVTFAAEANASGTTTYLDCSQSANGDGSQANPYNNIAAVNALTFGPGDTLAVHAGTSCTGTLSPKGSGTATAPISVQPYGTGSAPVINGNGAENALTLTNQDNWTIGAIKLTNPAPSETQREGLLIQSTDGTAHSGFDINGLLVDNVAGETNKATNAAQFSASAGIRFGAVNTGSLLNNVHVHNTQVTNCGGGGIKVRVGGSWGKGSNTLVEQNTVSADGGDGIIVSYAESPMIQYNTGANLGTGTYPYTGGNFAGMWVLGDHNPTLQHNVVYGTIMSAVDSEAFDCNWGNTNSPAPRPRSATARWSPATAARTTGATPFPRPPNRTVARTTAPRSPAAARRKPARSSASQANASTTPPATPPTATRSSSTTAPAARTRPPNPL